MAVRVVDVLPNSNLVIEGTRESSFSGEQQTIVLRGTIRQDDIMANNTVYSYNIADATIKFVSKGTITDSQRKGLVPSALGQVHPVLIEAADSPTTTRPRPIKCRNPTRTDTEPSCNNPGKCRLRMSRSRPCRPPEVLTLPFAPWGGFGLRISVADCPGCPCFPNGLCPACACSPPPCSRRRPL